MMDYKKAVQAGVHARAAEIEGELAGWLDDHTGPADAPALGVVLLRLTIAQYTAMMGERDALEFLHEMFSRPGFDA